MSPILADIVSEQGKAPAAEQDSWSGKGYSEVEVAGKLVRLFHGRALVPRGAYELKRKLMFMAHDAFYHLGGMDRTLITLQNMARVHWERIAADVAAYVKSCVRCQFARDVPPPKKGMIEFTHSTGPHHTWYIDFKGPMPHGTGYLMAVVCSYSRFVRLRYVKAIDAETVLAVLESVVCDFATHPAVIRCDNGPPFNSVAFATWCESRGIRLVPGVPYHSQGQGMVETRFRGIAHAFVASLGNKAPREWWLSHHLSRLEMFMNSMYCEPIGGSPYFVLYGQEPRTGLSAAAAWSTPHFGEAVGIPKFTYEELQSSVAEGHARMRAVQGLVMLGSNVAQTMTKMAYDASALPNDFEVVHFVGRA